MRNRSRLNQALREKAARRGAERAEEAEAAALEERTRIAGELHDVVAHALSAMTVQASAARRARDRDPDAARAAFAAVEAHRARGAHRAAPAARRAAQGGRGARARAAAEPRPRRRRSCAAPTAAGLPVELRRGRARAPLPAGVDLRVPVVQEALGARATPGAPAAPRSRIRYGAEDVVVEVADDGAPRGPPAARDARARRRLRRRAADAPAADGGGWRVCARGCRWRRRVSVLRRRARARGTALLALALRSRCRRPRVVRTTARRVRAGRDRCGAVAFRCAPPLAATSPWLAGLLVAVIASAGRRAVRPHDRRSSACSSTPTPSAADARGARRCSLPAGVDRRALAVYAIDDDRLGRHLLPRHVRRRSSGSPAARSAAARG